MRCYRRGRRWSALTDSISSERTISVRYDWSSYPVLSHFYKNTRQERIRQSQKIVRALMKSVCVSLRCLYIGPYSGEDMQRIFLFFLSEITKPCTSGKRHTEVTLFLIKLSNDAGTQEISMCSAARNVHFIRADSTKAHYKWDKF